MASFQDALRSRLNAIESLGETQTTWDRFKQQRDSANRAAKEELDWQKSLYNRMSIAARNSAGLDAERNSINMFGQLMSNISYGGVGRGKAANRGSAGFERFVSSIKKKESGGNYGAVNRHSGAMGAYQIMPGNIAGKKRGWDYEALGRDVSKATFMASPQIQDRIARVKLQQYYNRYGAAGASIAWYAGEGAANRYMKTGRASTRREGSYPSVNAYMRSITGR